MEENSFKIQKNDDINKLIKLDLTEKQLSICGIYSISTIAEQTFAPRMIVRSNFKVGSISELERIIKNKLNRKNKLKRILNES